MSKVNNITSTLIPYYPEYMQDDNLDKLDFYVVSKIRNLTEYTKGQGFKGNYYTLKRIACLNDVSDDDVKATLRKLLDEGYICRQVLDDGTMILKSISKQDELF